MAKLLPFSILIIFIFLVGCSETLNYEDEDVAAVIKGKEITIGELRFLYPDDQVLDAIDWAVKTELVKQETKNMNLDVSKENNEKIFATLPPENTVSEPEKSIREFAESQADKLGMQPETYQKEYVEKINEQNGYMVAYAQEMLGDLEDSQDETKYIEEGLDLLQRLKKIINIDDLAIQSMANGKYISGLTYLPFFNSVLSTSYR